MPPKNKKTAAGGADRMKDVNETEEALQAVVLADSYESRFGPLTRERPRCLLPLAGMPLIEYTLEFLAMSGVEEVFVYCGAHTNQVEDYINASKWTQPSSPFTLTLIRSTSRSIGDAMRDLDKRQIMTSPDFILVYGDIIANFSLSAALAAHRARRAKDKNAIMTMVLRAAGASHRTKAQGNSPVFVLDPSKERCLHYEQMSPSQPHHHVEIDPELLKEHQEIDVRHDLIDAGIDICTPDVLALWSDNFDYEAPRRGFLHSVLKDYELNGKTIHTYIVEAGQYAARVRNLRAYDAVAKDILGRWAWPMVPESNIMQDGAYSFAKGNVYVEEGAEVASSVEIGRGTQIGKGTKVAEGCKITGSVIGRNCKIGNHCTVEGSYIWDGTVIGNGCVIKKALIADGAVIGKECTLDEGALVSYGVTVADGKTVAARQRLTRTKRGKATAPAVRITDTSGNAEAHEYIPSDEEDVDAKAGLSGFYANHHASHSAASISTLHSTTSSLSDFDDHLQPSQHTRTRSTGGSFISVASDDSHPKASSADNAFHQDASTSIHEALRDGTDVSTIQLELQALRMSANASEHQVRRALVSALMRYIVEKRGNGASPVDASVVKATVTGNKMLLQRNIYDKASADGQKADQVDLLLLIQRDLASRAEKGGAEGLMVQICNELYLQDVIEQEGLEQWWEDAKSQEGEGMGAIRGGMERFMGVLMAESESEEESEEDEDEEESDEEDDD